MCNGGLFVQLTLVQAGSGRGDVSVLAGLRSSFAGRNRLGRHRARVESSTADILHVFARSSFSATCSLFCLGLAFRCRLPWDRLD